MVEAIHIIMDVFRANYLCDLDQLIVVVTPFEKRLFLEQHTSHHATSRPDVQAVVIVIVVQKEFGALEVPRGHAAVKSLCRLVEVSQAPIHDF